MDKSISELIKRLDPDLDLFHISFKEKLEGVWTPRNPDGYETPPQKYDKDEYKLSSKENLTEPNYPRISTAPTLEGCFLGVFPNISHLFEEFNYPFLLFHVYKASLSSKTMGITNEDLVEKKIIYDAHVTGEYQITSKTKMEHIKVIKIMNPKGSKDRFEFPFGDREKPKFYVGPKDIRIEQVK